MMAPSKPKEKYGIICKILISVGKGGLTEGTYDIHSKSRSTFQRIRGTIQRTVGHDGDIQAISGHIHEIVHRSATPSMW
jgi:hypothetical protein